MPTVAPAAPSTTPLAGLGPDAGATSAGTTDLLAGLFQSVLTQVVSQTAAGQLQAALGGATDAGPATSATATEANATASDALAGLLALTDQETPDTPVSQDLLSQLLAALGVNGQTIAQLPQTDTSATGTDADQRLATVVDPEKGLSLATLSPALQQVFDRSGLAPRARSAATAAAAPGGNDLSGMELPPTSVESDIVPSTDAPPMAAVAGAAQTGGRLPAVVLQTPVLSDPAQQLPPAATPVEPATGQPPVGAIPMATSAPAGFHGQPFTGSQLPDIELPIPGTAIPTPALVKNAFALPATTDLTIPTDGTAARPSVAPPQSPGPVPAAATPSTLPATQSVEAARTPAAVAAPAPGIAVTVAQPVSVSGSALGLSDWVGLTQPIAPAGAPEKPSTGDPNPLATVGFQPARQTDAPPVPVAAPAAPAPLTPSVAEQLNGPIVSHLRAQTVEGETELRIRLDPPELGAVKLKIVSTGGEVRAELHVSSVAVRRVVEGQLPELWQKLDDAGVRVQRMDVTADSAGNSNAGTARDNRDGRWDGPAPPEPSPLLPARPARPSAARAATAGNRIDLTA